MAGKLDDYVPVNERVIEAHQTFKDLVITTEVLEAGEYVRVKAVAYRSPETPLATAHAEAKRQGNQDKLLEKIESVAVGRCLAFGGFSASKAIASREEMEEFQSNGGPVEVQGGEVSFPSAAEAAAEMRGIGKDEAVQLEPLVRDWLAGEGGDKEKLKMKLISLGVTEPNVKLTDALAQIPTAKKAQELLSWMGKNNAMTPEQFADALIEEGVAVEK